MITAIGSPSSDATMQLLHQTSSSRISVLKSPLDSAVSKLVEDNGLGLLSDPNDIAGIAEAIKGEVDVWAEQSDGAAIAREVQARFDVRNSVQILSQAIDSFGE